MLFDHTSVAHDPSSPSTADSPSLSTSSTSLDSGSGRYQPGLILYPYRRSSTSSLPSPSLIPVWKGLGGGAKRSGRLFGETKASPLKVSVADSPKPLSSMVMLDPLGAVKPKKGEDKTRTSTKESLKPVEMLSEVVVARSELDPTTITVRRSEDIIKPSHINKKPTISSIPVAAASNLSTGTVLNESAIDKSPNLRANDSIVKKLNTDTNKHSTASSLPIFERRPPSGDNSRVYVSKQALATIGRGFSVKPLRLALKVKDTMKGSSPFMSESAKPTATKQSPIQDDPPRTNARSTTQTTSNTPSTANLGGVIPRDGSGTVESDDPLTDDPLSIPSEATTRSGYCSQAIRDSFIVDGRSPVVDSTVDSPRDTSNDLTLSDSGKSGPAPSVPIFKQRPSSGEWNRKDVFRRMSAMVQAPAIKPLGLKKASVELDLNQLSLGATRPAWVQEGFSRVNEGEVDPSQSSQALVKSNEAPTELNDSSEPVQVNSSVAVPRGPPPTTHDELMDLFDEVQDLYSTSNAPTDPYSCPDDLIKDAFVLDGRVVPVSRSAGSRQDVSANHDSGAIEKEDEAFKEWSPSWQDVFSKASAMAGLAPVKPLRVANKAKWLVKKPTEVEASGAKIAGVDISTTKLNEVESGKVRMGEVRPLKAESCIVQATVIEGLAATVCGMAEVQSGEAQICRVSPDGSLVEIPVKVESVPSEHGSIAGGANTSTLPDIPDLYVSAYEDCSQVVVKTAGRKSRREGINRDLLYAYHVFRAPQPSPNQEPVTTKPSLMSGPKPAAAVDPGSSSALVSQGRTDDSSNDLEEARPNESLTSAFDSDSDDDEDGDEDDDDDYDFGRDYFVVESDPFEYDLIASGSSQVLSSELLAGLDDDGDSDDDNDDYGTNPFKYDYHLDLPSSPNEVTPLTPVLESSSAVSSPESTPPTTPTSMDLSLPLPPSFDVAGKLVESPAQNERWAWNDMDDMDEDREGAIGTAL
ncbi:hypothetical protein FRC12_009361 [Ceratobasidium sp. 428]|nr:hypothetical protein FRC12_009361 [Ceratobasidium sp. 428]